jgi:hypothetical protein
LSFYFENTGVTLEAVEVYQVGTCRGADGVATKAEEKAAGQPPANQCREAGIIEAEWQAPGPDDLLLEGEEGEYFLELLMRKDSPERPKVDQLMGGKENMTSEAASAKGKDKKKSKKKALKESKVVKENGAQGEGKSAAGLTSKQGKQAAPDLLSNPEAKGRGLVAGDRVEEESMTRSTTTSRGECSGQKMPDS